MKKDQYFNLEVNLLNDDNIAGMMSELDAGGSARHLCDVAVAPAHER